MISSTTPFRHVKSLIPKLEKTLHKGQAGRIGVIGGSAEYTGAPYYAAAASLRTGADLSFIFCGELNAAIPIKTYSPELIVFPSISHLNSTLDRLTALVIGPGLGRNEEILEQVSKAIQDARAAEVPIVLDGDALWLLKDKPDLIRGYHKAIITPNAMEFERLFRTAFNSSAPKIDWNSDYGVNTTSASLEFSTESEPGLSVSRLANWLHGVTVLRKGVVDVISDGRIAIGCSAFGSSRRCGGQGDVLAGASGVFLSWSQHSKTNPVFAAFGASLLTRRANLLAFEIEGRSMTTPDMLKTLGKAFRELYDDENSPYCFL